MGGLSLRISFDDVCDTLRTGVCFYFLSQIWAAPILRAGLVRCVSPSAPFLPACIFGELGIRFE